MMRIAIAGSAILSVVLLTQPAIADAKASDGDKKVCRSAADTGSIIPKRICHSRDEWKSIDTAAESARDRQGRSNTIDRGQGGAGNATDSFGQKNN